MRKGLVFSFFLLSSQLVFAQNEIGPEGSKLVWFLLAIVLLSVGFIFTAKPFKKNPKEKKQPFFRRRKLNIELKKDALYYPDFLTLKIKNSGNTDIDVDQPLLVFDNFWLTRKFKIKGMENHSFYPLYLEKGKTHTLQIDLNRFYRHDKKLKKFPKTKIILRDVNGKKLGHKSVFLRKTLLKF